MKSEFIPGTRLFNNAVTFSFYRKRTETGDANVPPAKLTREKWPKWLPCSSKVTSCDILLLFIDPLYFEIVTWLFYNYHASQFSLMLLLCQLTSFLVMFIVVGVEPRRVIKNFKKINFKYSNSNLNTWKNLIMVNIWNRLKINFKCWPFRCDLTDLKHVWMWCRLQWSISALSFMSEIHP